MKALDKDRILRINCPGYGEQSFFSAGCARPLHEYDVIVVNPISILHLFDKDPELLKQIASSQGDGMTSYIAKSDKLLQSVQPDLEQRQQELVRFLADGGLLVYFLCPPFIVQGPQELQDNYGWLDVLAPDKPKDKKDRHMSSASRGKNIEVTMEGSDSPFAAYFRQPGLEWSTVIRAENLTEGYTCLALAGPNKCIAAAIDAGDNGGKVVFLPAPYQPEFDKGLIDAANAWYDTRTQAAAAPRPARKEAAPEPVPAAPAKQEKRKPEKAPEATAPGPEGKVSPEPSPPPSEPQREEKQERPPGPEAKVEPEPEAKAEPEPQPEPAKEPQGKRPEPEGMEQPAPPVEKPPKAKELMEKMEEISKTAVPDWCLNYSFSDLDMLREQLNELNEQVRLTEQKIAEVEGRIDTMEWLKNALLAGEDDELARACTKVFEAVGWGVTPSDSQKGELWLTEAGTTVAITRIVRTTSQVKRADLAQLAESVITYWGEHEHEPKGILVANTWANRPPSERTEPDYTDALAEFAEKKNLCLMTTWQLLCIYRDVEGGYASTDGLKESVLATRGRLEGFSLEPSLAAAAS